MAKTYASVSAAIAALTKIEKAEEGYLEKKSASKLYSKTENAGYNNYTKYWRDLAKEGLMGQSSTFAGGPAWYWCAGLQSWCFIKAFGKENAKKLLLHLPYTSCAQLGSLAAKAKRLYKSPKAGDIVLFWNGSRFCHTGYVYKVEGGRFYTSEGNTNKSDSVVPNGGAVCLKSYPTSAYVARGARFFRPDYTIVVDKKKATAKKTPAKKATTSKATATKKEDTTKKTTTTKASTTKKTTATNKTVIVNTKKNPLNCREKAAKSAAVVGKFAKGTKLKVVSTPNKSFTKVTGKSMSGKVITGFCASEFLK